MLQPCERLEDCLQYHDELLAKAQSSQKYLDIHNEMGVEGCDTNPVFSCQCKMAFRSKFSKALVEQYAEIVGTKNRVEEDYQRGDKTYKERSAEAHFYQPYKILKGAKSVFIGDFIKKIWYLLGQRAPTINAGEKFLRSTYGRPLYKMMTGKEVPKEMWCDIDDILVIDKGIVDACMKDIQHTFSCYERLQKSLHVEFLSLNCVGNQCETPSNFGY